MSLEKRRCGSCLYGRKVEGAAEVVFCCRYPKVPVDGRFEFPQMKVDEWCGEWQAVEVEFCLLLDTVI